MNKQEFFQQLRDATESITELPDWKHNLLLDSFKSVNSQPRPAIIHEEQSETLNQALKSNGHSSD
ncbi:MAG: hypothetical protein COA78_30000 [Blastopirellula sp.]|nr:MAG: hypothetical protein COA78_30000 [Blastopirellula sp.]